uniref:Variant surface glycoprotein 663 n=1 Tax=Trypanosoma brucei TaxID=5691 RepID=M4SXQ0_9TRYP|nr:variant surface glycoprotein 663 [Trypanosoma brucei]
MLGPTLLCLIAITTIQTCNANEVQPCTTNCGCWARLEKQMAIYRADITKAVASLSQNKKDFHRLIAAATVATDHIKARLAPVLPAAAAIIDSCEAALEKATGLAAEAQSIVGQLQAVYNLQHRLATGGGEFNIEVKTDNFINANEDLVKTDLGKLNNQGCGGDLAKLDNAEITKQNMRNLQEPPKLITHVHIQARCQRDGTRNNGCQATGNLNGNGKFEVKLIYDNAEKNEKATWLSDTSAAKTISSTAVDFIGNLSTNAKHALDALAAADPAEICNKKIRSWPSIAAHKNFEALVTAAFNALHRAGGDDRKQQEALKTAVTEFYGKEGREFEQRVWDELDTAAVYNNHHESGTQRKITSLETLTDIGEAAARGLVKQLATGTQQRTAASDGDQSTEKKCSGKKGDDCKGDCELVDEVCKPKKKGDGQNKDKNGTTNTTASNSILINKAPLLLAFLLF